MDNDYRITESILTVLTKFYDLHGKIYGIFNTFDKNIQDIIRSEAREIAAFSAVASDIGSMDRLSHDWNTKLINKLLTKEEKISFEKYTGVLNNFDKYFSQETLLLSKEQLLVIHKILVPNEQNDFRTESKVISSITIEDGVKYEYKSEVRTHPQAIQSKLDSYFKWINADTQIQPAILAAITYLKIAEIHPFLEANGRMSKILSRAVLYRNNVDPLIILPIYDYFLENQNYYFDMIDQTITSGDMTKWIEFYCKGLLHSALQTSKLINIYSAGAIDLVSNKFIKLSERERFVLMIIMRKKNASGAEIGRELKVSRQNVNVIIKGLLKKGIIRKIGKNTGVRYIPI